MKRSTANRRESYFIRKIRTRMFLSFLCFFSANAQELPSIRWVGYAKGDLNKAKLLRTMPRPDSIQNYCLHFQPTLFDPFNVRSADSLARGVRYFTKMYALISIPPADTAKTYSLRLLLHRTLPVCTECDSACMTVGQNRTDTVFVSIATKKKQLTRRLVDIGRYVKDWHLIDLEVVATLIDRNVGLNVISMLVSGWPWCK